ncbi:unnamed protein product [Cylicocyclus nassatus]|uniref:Transmembrane protein n=1 Tax=Cylicocyclus nassatus TaxID=53992 RepID=A0AA36DR09_CYLNA|nr:unnamed protein product [Cylicocyclus nassatus]
MNGMKLLLFSLLFLGYLHMASSSKGGPPKLSHQKRGFIILGTEPPSIHPFPITFPVRVPTN